jgi:hypothetical protein
MGMMNKKTLSITFIVIGTVALGLLYQVNHQQLPSELPVASPSPSASPNENIVPTSTPEITPSRPTPAATKEENSFSKLLKFTPGNHMTGPQWKIVTNVVAVPRSEKKASADVLKQIPQYDLLASPYSFTDTRGKVIVYNPAREQVGVFSGIIMVELKNNGDLKPLTNQYHLQVEHFFENINTAFVKTRSMHELIQLKMNLPKDARVKRVEVEVLENQFEKQ